MTAIRKLTQLWWPINFHLGSHRVEFVTIGEARKMHDAARGALFGSLVRAMLTALHWMCLHYLVAVKWKFPHFRLHTICHL